MIVLSDGVKTASAPSAMIESTANITSSTVVPVYSV